MSQNLSLVDWLMLGGLVMMTVWMIATF